MYPKRHASIVNIKHNAERMDEVINRGKKFEDIIKTAFEKVPGVSIDRIPDQTTRYKGSTNICDFIVYKDPHEYYFECKSVHGNTLSIYSIPKKGKDGKPHGFYGNIRDNQWDGLLQKSQINGVFAGVICWWIDRDITLFIPIQKLQEYRDLGFKSIRFDIFDNAGVYQISGKKKRIFFDYDMEQFLKEVI